MNVVYPDREFTVGIRVAITRYVSDDPQPGIVECQLIDAHDKVRKFVEKTAVVCDRYIDERTTYPIAGTLAAEVVSWFTDEQGREVVRVTTPKPFCIESPDGFTEFEITSDFIVAWREN